MLPPQRAVARFLSEPEPSSGLVSSALRLTFVMMFMAQVAVALLVVALILLLGGTIAGGPTVLGPVLALLALAQCFLGVLLPDALSRTGSKGSVLSATLLSAVLLATPAWFLMLALLTGQAPLALLLLLAALLTGYALGFWLCGRLGRRAAAAGRKPN
ncbi:MAG TPA: hypothetical protein VF168_13025 [Trueperaceae bacterium]